MFTGRLVAASRGELVADGALTNQQRTFLKVTKGRRLTITPNQRFLIARLRVDRRPLSDRQREVEHFAIRVRVAVLARRGGTTR